MIIKRAIYDVAEFKALPDQEGEKGRFEAMVSVFGNVDLQGDRVLDGAFQKSIEEWRASGAPIPIIWSHQWGDPNAHIGSANADQVTEVKGKGLKVAGSIDLDNPFAAQVYRLLKERRVREFSFGYEVIKERPGKDKANELVELRLIEAGPTLKGANPSTELLAVKSALEDAASESESPEPVVDETVRRYIDTKFAEFTDVVGLTKAGRTISGKNEAKIRGAVESLSEVLASLGDADEKTVEDEADTSGKATVDPEILAINSRLMKLTE